MKESILIAGGSGYIGRHLTEYLEQHNYDVTWICRGKMNDTKRKFVSWDYQSPSDHVDEAILKSSIIINLCGASVGEKRWTKSYKETLFSSRLIPTKKLVERILHLQAKPALYIQTSAIGFYGTDGRSEPYHEEDVRGKGFLADLCDRWERGVQPLREKSIPVTVLRIAPVFNHGSVVFEKWASPFRYGLGAVIGTGRQYFPCIHIEDLCRIFLWVIDHKKQGVYNAVQPNAEQHKDVAHAIAGYFNKPIRLPSVPPFVLRIMYGEAGTMITKGDPVSSEKLMKEGFSFLYPNVKEWLIKKQ